MKPVVLSRGKPYPHAVAAREGAAAEFLRTDGHVLQIGLPNLQPSEIKVIRKATVKAGFVNEGPLILWVFEFGDIIFDCPFDARLIPRSLLSLPTIENDRQRLLIEVHLVDTATNILRGLRHVTLSPSLTRSFLAAVQEQIARSEPTDGALARWQRIPVARLPAFAKMERCGL